MRISRRSMAQLAAAVLGVFALTAASVANARDLHWSVGIGSPGVQIGVSSGYHPYYGSTVVLPAPVYVQRPTIVVPSPGVYYSQPQIVYGAPQVVYPAQPYYVQPPRVFYGVPQPHHGHRHGRGHGRHGGHRH